MPAKHGGGDSSGIPASPWRRSRGAPRKPPARTHSRPRLPERASHAVTAKMPTSDSARDSTCVVTTAPISVWLTATSPANPRRMPAGTRTRRSQDRRPAISRPVPAKLEPRRKTVTSPRARSASTIRPASRGPAPHRRCARGSPPPRAESGRCREPGSSGLVRKEAVSRNRAGPSTPPTPDRVARKRSNSATCRGRRHRQRLAAQCPADSIRWARREPDPRRASRERPAEDDTVTLRPGRSHPGGPLPRLPRRIRSPRSFHLQKAAEQLRRRDSRQRGERQSPGLPVAVPATSPAR